MPGQLWGVAADGGYLYSDELSDIFRNAVQPLTKMRNFCDAEDGMSKGLHRGQYFNWDIISDLSTRAQRLSETAPIPQTSFTVTQGQLTVVEWGNSVAWTEKLDNLSKAPAVKLIDKALKHDARKLFDAEAWTQFNATPLRVAPTGGNSTTAVTLTTNGATATTNNVAMGTGHIKAISDTMKERNIPPYEADAYFCISHPTTFRGVKNSLESIHQYTSDGLQMIRFGEIGRYEDFRFIEQNNIPKGGANDSTAFSAFTNTADEWNNALSSWAFFFGKSLPRASVTVH